MKLAKKAVELIDLNKHTGEHPRMGCVDVMVPAMNYLASMPEGLGIGSSYDPFMTFHRRIDFYATKYIEAGKVYDVLCECGLEAGCWR